MLSGAFYLAGERMGVIIFVGLVTALYTATGGLLVSIITDQAQVGITTAKPPDLRGM